MKKSILEAQLSATPAPIRKSMLEEHDKLPAGATSVVNRLFEIVASRQEPLDAPSEKSFREVAESESTLRLLLRTLKVHAPHVSTAAALPVKDDWLKARPKVVSSKTAVKVRKMDTAKWPEAWQALLPGLQAAKIKPSTLKRYIASIFRCADAVRTHNLPTELSFLTGYEIARVLSAQDEPVSAITIANYLEALIALGRHGGADPAGLTGLAFVSQEQRNIARSQGKKKAARIDGFMARGTYQHIANIVAEQREIAARAAGHSYKRKSAHQNAAICAITLNMPARAGDMSRWIIGRELVRSANGDWSLSWTQEKTGKGASAGVLWPEVSELLDEHLLGDRPPRLIAVRYRECLGFNWLSLTQKAYLASWPSLRFKQLVGVPLHDMRTVLADHMRWHDPQTAADIIQTALGHSTAAAGEAYRSECEGDFASKAWAEVRKITLIGSKKR